MDAQTELNDTFLSQAFIDDDETVGLKKFQIFACGFAQIENAMTVLSDLKEGVSYMYSGEVAETLGLAAKGSSKVLPSIWENEIFDLVHPDDMRRRHLDELRFFHFIKKAPKQKRTNYYLSTHLRIRDKEGKYIPIHHRIYYVAFQPNGSVRLALCLYNIISDFTLDCSIINSANGERISVKETDCANFISDREKEILELIDKGKQSKNIADALSISIHTVNRHRQNILEKLNAVNSIEACQIAKQLHLL